MNKLKYSAVLALIILSATASNAQKKPDSVKPLTIGEVRTLKSEVLGEDRRLNIYLPEKFDKTKT